MNYNTEIFSASSNDEMNISGAKKKRRTSVKALRALQQHMVPPISLSGYGDTVIVSNPFDDAPKNASTNINCHQGQFFNQDYLGDINSQIPSYQDSMSIENIQATSKFSSAIQNWNQFKPPQNQSTIKKKPTKRAIQNASLKKSPSTKRKQTSAKIYPGDQPVIFNFDNPHTPPIYPCGICHKEVNENDQGIICESGCNFWFHRTCLGLSEAAFFLLTQEIYAEWACDNCIRSKNIPMVKFKP